MMRIIYVFGNQPYGEALKAACDSSKFEVFYLNDERADKPNYAKSPQAIFQEFEAMYQEGQDIAACINLARGSVVKGVENIAKAWDLIKEAYPRLTTTPFIGPTYEAAQIFTHKNAMAQLFKQLKLDTPETVLIPNDADNNFFNGLIRGGFPLPAVLKAPELSGGRGMVLVGSTAELMRRFKDMRKEGHYDLVLSEFIEGIEVSFAVLRIGETSVRLPACYKEPTTRDLAHPDNKVKMAGAFKKFDLIYATIEDFMKQMDMQGLLYLEAILKKNKQGYEVKFLEGAARISGNSPIEFAALRGFNFYQSLAEWIDAKQFNALKEERLCIQYASYKHHGPDDALKLRQFPWVIEAKYEEMGYLPFAKNQRSRIRISFIGEDFAEAYTRALKIAQIIDDVEYAEHIKSVFALYQVQYPELIG